MGVAREGRRVNEFQQALINRNKAQYLHQKYQCLRHPPAPECRNIADLKVPSPGSAQTLQRFKVWSRRYRSLGTGLAMGPPADPKISDISGGEPVNQP
jgi:hypothetical protein